MRPLLAHAGIILRNDLRLSWRELLAGRRGAFLSVGLVAALFALANIVSVVLFFAIGGHPSVEAETVVWLWFAFMMLGMAMNQAITVLFERADFDLLLPAPMPSGAILLARLAAMMTAAAAGTGFFLLPVINGAFFALSWRYLAGYLVWLLLACTVASVAVWGTLLLVRWLGARRARTWAQVIAATLGGSVYLAVQAQNMVSTETRQRTLAWAQRVANASGVTFLAHAGRGEIAPLTILLAVAAVSAFATSRLLNRMFVTGVQEAGAVVPRARRHHRRHVFREGIAPATFLKDLRLIVRDPLLLSQLLPTAIYVVPILLGFRHFGSAVILGPIAVLITSQFSFALAAVAASGEECWDLIQMSPTPERQLRYGKLAAAMTLPLAVAVVLTVTLLVLGHPWAGLLTLVYCIGTGAAAGWMQVTRIKPTPRRDILRRGRVNNDRGRSLLSGFLMIIAAGGLGFAGAGHWLISTVLLTIAALMIGGCFALFAVEDMHA